MYHTSHTRVLCVSDRVPVARPLISLLAARVLDSRKATVGPGVKRARLTRAAVNNFIALTTVARRILAAAVDVVGGRANETQTNVEDDDPVSETVVGLVF
jgi:hypothetical protein